MKNKIFLFAMAFIIVSCGEDNCDCLDIFSVAGQIVNVTEVPVPNVKLKLVHPDNVEDTIRINTDSVGFFLKEKLNEGNYKIILNATGYTEKVVNSYIPPDSTLKIILEGKANITGRVTNEFDNTVISNAVVCFNRNGDTSTANTVFKATTNSNGDYSVSKASTGSFIRIIRKNGFIPHVSGYITLISGINNLQQVSMLDTLPSNGIRIYLTWGSVPADLDAYLTGPADQNGLSHFTCYSSNLNLTQARLNKDVSQGYGPEIIKVKPFYNGIFRFSVKNSTNNTASGIYNSPTKIEVYNHQGVKIKTYNAPYPGNNPQGQNWWVFEYIKNGDIYSFNDNNNQTLGYFSGN